MEAIGTYRIRSARYSDTADRNINVMFANMCRREFTIGYAILYASSQRYELMFWVIHRNFRQNFT